MTNDVIMQVKNLSTYYKTRLNEKVFAVDNVSLDIRKGEVIGIAGESGCGKSTLALSLMGYYIPPLHYNGGEIIIGDNIVTKMSKEEKRKKILGTEIAYIPQAAMNALNPTQKIIKFIIDAVQEHKPNMTKQQITEMAEKRFEQVNLPPRVLQSFPNELSGGMKQRTVIAISTLLNPRILIADEPTSALDVTSQKVVISMLKKLMDEGIVQSMFFITHELPLLRHVASRIVVMYTGELVEKGTSEEIIFNPTHPYSKALMGSIIVPEEGMKGIKLEAIPGAPPNLKNPPKGCRFAERCEYASKQCSEPDRIEMIEYGQRREYRCIHNVDTLHQMFAKDNKNDMSLAKD